MVSDEDAEAMVLEAIAKEKTAHIRFLHHLNMELYGHHSHILNLLHDGKTNEVIELLESLRKIAQDKIINR